MSSKPKIELFEGNNSQECTTFIRAIRETAWAEGRLRDPAWMADFASLYFSGKAMSWHGKLPLDVRQDWFKMEGALIDRWAPADEDDDPQIQPVPAAAPKQVAVDGTDSVVNGVLVAINNDGGRQRAYIKRGSVDCNLTGDKRAALHVRFTSGAKQGLLECNDGSMCSSLAIHWNVTRPDLGRGSNSWATPTFVSCDNLGSSWGHTGLWQLMGCTVSEKAKGEVTPVWRDTNNNKEIPLSVFISEASVFLVVDPEGYSRKVPTYKRASQLIERHDKPMKQ